MNAAVVEADVAIVGAGLAGLAAARELTTAGADVVLVDKGRRAGGRCATRVVAGANCDSGAQFFTARSEIFRGLIDAWRGEGVAITVWGHGWAQARHVADGPSAATDGGDGGDGHPRHAVAGGMNVLAAHLARELDVRASQRVTALVPHDGSHGLTVVGVGDGVQPWTLRAPRVLWTPPLPQTLALLEPAGVAAGADVRARSGYAPTLALLLALDAPPALPRPGGVQLTEGPVAWLGDNQAKGASSSPALTVHASPSFSRDHLNDAAATGDLLHAAVRPWLGPARVRASELFRWCYAQPEDPSHDGAVALGDGLVLAGDVHAGAKVEGAVRSGLAAADLLRS